MALLGNDLSGTVVSLGSNIVNKSIQVGDKVACVIHGGQFKDQGAYAEYAKAQSDLIWKVPEGLGMPEASTFGVGYCTAAQVSTIKWQILNSHVGR